MLILENLKRFKIEFKVILAKNFLQIFSIDPN